MVDSPQPLQVGKRKKPLGRVALRAMLGADDLECVGSKACGLKGKLRIYMGSGPCVCQQLLSAFQSCEEIIATGYRVKNHLELEKWLKKTPGAFGLSQVVKSV